MFRSVAFGAGGPEIVVALRDLFGEQVPSGASGVEFRRPVVLILRSDGGRPAPRKRH